MQLLTKTIRAGLLRNGRVRQALAEGGKAKADFIPLVKLFTPHAACTWLLTELDPEDEDLAFGLCDLGLGCPELGYVRIGEIAGLHGKLGLAVERDLHFVAKHTLSIYARAARKAESITERPDALRAAAIALAGGAA